MIYLTEEEIIKFNRYLIDRYSPSEPAGVVHSSVLNMIIELPKQNVFGEELYPTVVEKSATLYKNLVQKNIFLDANKRTAYFSLIYFLNLNGCRLNVSSTEAVNFTLKIEENSLSNEDVAEWIGNYIEHI